MARNVPAALAEPLTAEESGMMDADRDSEHSQPEPEAEPEPAPEAAPAKQPELALEEHDDDGPAIDPKTGQERKVNYGALREERTKRREAQAEVSKVREELAKFNGRWETLQQLAQRQQQPQTQPPAQDEVPDINLDPVGHFQAKDAIRERELAELRNWKQAQDQQSSVRNNVQRLQEIAQQHEAEFSKATPDYQEAFEYLRKSRDQELQYMGFSDAGVREQHLKNDALNIAAHALNGNKNAAEVVYNMAKARGYGTKAPAPVPVIAAQQPDAIKIAKVAKGQEAGQSIGQVNGSAPAETSIESVLKMSDKDFAKWATDDNFRKLAGG